MFSAFSRFILRLVINSKTTEACEKGLSFLFRKKYCFLFRTVTEFFDGQVVNSEVIAIQLLPKADVTYDNLNPPVRVTLTLINVSFSLFYAIKVCFYMYQETFHIIRHIKLCVGYIRFILSVCHRFHEYLCNR